MHDVEKHPRFLITNFNESTWKYDVPVLFLGEWCRIYSRRNIWQEMDSVVAKPYGLSPEEKDDDFKTILSLEQSMYPRICRILNEFHGIDYNEKQWRILTNHWFRRYLAVIINRVQTVQHCLNNYSISGFNLNRRIEDFLIPASTLEAQHVLSSDDWNAALYGLILKEHGVPSTSGYMEKVTGTANFVESGLFNIKKFIRSCFRFCISIFVKINDAFIVNSYLPGWDQARLEISFFQVPQFRQKEQISIQEEANISLRNSLYRQLVDNSAPSDVNSISYFAEKLFFYCLPICFLEGFNSLNKLLQAVKWPISPKFIFTSVNFDTDELFKLWVARQVKEGTIYIVGQHGNGPVIFRHKIPTPDQLTCDFYISWGYEDLSRNIHPAYIFKTAGDKQGRFDPKGNLLLIQKVEALRHSTWDDTYEFRIYFEELLNFVFNLNDEPKQSLVVRPPLYDKNAFWGSTEHWREKAPSVRIDNTKNKITKLISKSRLVIHSYDSTGILETLSQDIPTLAFWENEFDHLSDDAIPYYERLLNAGIIHFTSDSAAKKVNEIWHDIPGWWSSKKVQVARKGFCKRYARNSNTPVHTLNKILSNCVHEK